MKLEIELIPKTSFFSNVRALVSANEWDVIRKKCYSLAGYKCEICSGKGSKWPVECHEVWDYNNKTKIQKLTRLIALCPSCHEVKHIGLAKIKGRYKEAIKHLMKVNNIDQDSAYEISRKAFELWNERNNTEWKLDVKYLKEFLK